MLKFYGNGKEYTFSLILDFPLENVVCCCCLKLEGFAKFSSNTHGKQMQSRIRREQKGKKKVRRNKEITSFKNV